MKENAGEGESEVQYKCYLNGSLYGRGSLAYMGELFIDYTVTNKMYGKEYVSFNVEPV